MSKGIITQNTYKVRVDGTPKHERPEPPGLPAINSNLR